MDPTSNQSIAASNDNYKSMCPLKLLPCHCVAWDHESREPLQQQWWPPHPVWNDELSSHHPLFFGIGTLCPVLIYLQDHYEFSRGATTGRKWFYVFQIFYPNPWDCQICLTEGPELPSS